MSVPGKPLINNPGDYYKQAFFAGLVVGTLDILAAFLHFYLKTGRNPTFILKYIASGVFEDAYPGSGMMIWGLIFHFLIALSFSLFFFWLVSKVSQLLNYKILTAIGYGIFMWAITTFIVIPLSRIKPAPVKPINALLSIAILVVCISVPLIYFASRALKNQLLKNEN